MRKLIIFFIKPIQEECSVESGGYLSVCRLCAKPGHFAENLSGKGSVTLSGFRKSCRKQFEVFGYQKRIKTVWLKHLANHPSCDSRFVGIIVAQFGHLAGGILEPMLSMDLPPEAVLFIFLPTLVFESAFNLEVRALKENLAPVLMLAIPGLLISTFMIGGFMVLMVGMEWPVALLLGSMLSATDPVGVIALFRQLGAPKRLTLLVEGESLFNDATSIVAARIIQTVMLAGVITTSGVFDGILTFFIVFVGGLVVGWIFALLVGQLMGKVEGDAFIEISLTAVLAYFAFILAIIVFR